jgi:transposase
MYARALGWDIHRKFSMVSIREISESGEIVVIERRRLDHADREAMCAFLRSQPPGTPVAMEAAFGWPWIADLVEACGLEPHLAHPPAVRVLAKHQAKTDRCDADRTGEFCLQGILPESYLAPREVRALRERIRYRMSLSQLRTGLKHRIHAQLHRQGILHPFSDLFGKRGQDFLRALPLPDVSRAVLDGYRRVLQALDVELAAVEAWMTENLHTDKTTQLLETLPGVGKILAHVIQAEIGQIERFPTARHLSSYAGLAPLSDDSALRHGRRHCSPACNRTLRWALIEAATFITSRGKARAPRLFRLYQRLTHGGRVNKGQAKVAVARELAKLVYVVWRKRQPYSLEPPARPGSQVAQDTKTRSVIPMRAGKSRRPMVRRRATAGQALT